MHRPARQARRRCRLQLVRVRVGVRVGVRVRVSRVRVRVRVKVTVCSPAAEHAPDQLAAREARGELQQRDVILRGCKGV